MDRHDRQRRREPQCRPAPGSAPLFATVTVTGVAVVSLPAASRAMAVDVCEPFPPSVVSQLTLYGADEVLDAEGRTVDLELDAVDADVVARPAVTATRPRTRSRRSRAR